jgi:hypothetical protein
MGIWKQFLGIPLCEGMGFWKQFFEGAPNKLFWGSNF